MPNLTAKQEAFVNEYLIDLNATQAAIRAGYSEHTANEIGSQNLAKVSIQEAIQVLMDERRKRTVVTQDMVVKELARIAFLDIRNAYNDDGELLAIPDMPEDVARAVGGMDIRKVKTWGKGDDEAREEEWAHNIKLIDKKGALELLGRHLKMYTDKVEQTGTLNVNISPKDAGTL